MATKIFVNLPVKNLDRSVEFFTKLGFSFNAQFTDETATCMVVSEDIFVMLLTEAKFKEFTPNPICDATKSTEVLVCLSSESREEVDKMIRNAVAAGGTTYNEPQDYGFMYSHGFQDLDGHIWETMFMEPSAVNQGQAFSICFLKTIQSSSQWVQVSDCIEKSDQIFQSIGFTTSKANPNTSAICSSFNPNCRNLPTISILT